MANKPKNNKQDAVSISDSKQSFQLSLNVTYSGPREDFDTKHDDYNIRIASEWLDCCCSTDILGSPGFPLVGSENDGSNISIASYSFECEPNMSLNSDKFQLFNTCSGIFAFLMKKSVEPEQVTILPISFAYVDCSILSLRKGHVSARSETVDNITIDIMITSSKALLSEEVVLELEPVVLNIQGLTRFPLDGMSATTALNSLYLYHGFDRGDGSVRHIYGKPMIIQSTDDNKYDSDSDDEVDHSASIGTCLLDLQVCLFPSLSGLDTFKEMLTSKSFTLELYDNPTSIVMFTSAMVEEFNKTFYPSTKATKKPDVKTPSSKANDKKTAKDKDKEAEKSKNVVPVTNAAINMMMSKSSAGPIIASDRYLIKAIIDSLFIHRDLYAHGCGRYRLEQLLSDSAEIALRYAEKRRSQYHHHNDNNGDNEATGQHQIVVEDDMMVDIRYENPIKPQAWKFPTDLSLKKALLNNISLSKQVSSISVATVKRSVFELCVDHDTQLMVTAQLYKHLPSTSASSNQSSSHSRPTSSNRGVDNNTSLAKKRSNTTTQSPSTSVSTAKQASATTLKTSSPSTSTSSTISKEHDMLKQKADHILSTILSTSSLPEASKMLLAKKLVITPYGRMIIVMDYNNDAFLMRVNDIIKAVNSKALPDIQGNLMSHILSASENDALAAERLDLISGFMMIDDNKRIIVIEGLAYPGYSMEYVYHHISHDDVINGTDNANTKILYHPSILFPNRLYPQYTPDLKRIHLRCKIKKLILKTELYSREQIDEVCFDGIDKLASLLRVEDFYTCKKFDFFPTMASLEKIELLYGESITRVDITGSIIENQRLQQVARRTTSSNNDNCYDIKTPIDMMNTSSNIIESQHHHRISRLAATNTINHSYLQHLHQQTSKPSRDYLHEQRHLRQVAYDELLLKNQYKKTQQQQFLQSIGSDHANHIHVYSNQALNYKRKAFEVLRKKLFHQQHSIGIYTYSKDYVSQTLSYEDNDSIQAKLFAYNHNHSNTSIEDRQKWMTKKGFQYPVPKTTQESLIHPNKPSDKRIVDLKQPWMNDMIPPTGSSTGYDDQGSIDPIITRQLIDREKKFHTYHKSLDVFGCLKTPQYEHPCQISHIGDRTGQLPRGTMMNANQQNPDFFHSIHLAGDEQQRIIQEASKKEKADWKAKVIVDHEDFKVDGFLVKDRVTSQIDRYVDILHDQPNRIALKKIRDHKSTTKKMDWSYQTTPMTIINKNEPYVDNIAKVGLRVVEKDKFITARDIDITKKDEPKEFNRYISTNASAPRIVKMMSTRPLIQSSAINPSGPKWEPAS